MWSWQSRRVRLSQSFSPRRRSVSWHRPASADSHRPRPSALGSRPAAIPWLRQGTVRARPSGGDWSSCGLVRHPSDLRRRQPGRGLVGQLVDIVPDAADPIDGRTNLYSGERLGLCIDDDLTVGPSAVAVRQRDGSGVIVSIPNVIQPERLRSPQPAGRCRLQSWTTACAFVSNLPGFR